MPRHGPQSSAVGGAGSGKAVTGDAEVCSHRHAAPRTAEGAESRWTGSAGASTPAPAPAREARAARQRHGCYASLGDRKFPAVTALQDHCPVCCPWSVHGRNALGYTTVSVTNTVIKWQLASTMWLWGHQCHTP